MIDRHETGRNKIEDCEERLNIEFNNLCYYPSGKKVRTLTQKPILKNICGRFLSGRLTALVGPSGAGKTSLINVLSGFITTGVTGSVKINGRDRNVQKFRKKLCYITQEFAILHLLTTRETLMIAADLKLNADIGKLKKNEMVNEILALLGLEKVMNTPVGKLSGGEKKRLSIGLELLTNPPVMFFDEPTSGLDSFSSLQVISHLKSLAEGGRTVVCSIHQPSSRLFQMFDDMYLIAEGQCLYNGPISDLTSVFKEAGFLCPNFYNRADFAIEVASGQRGNNTDKLIAKFNSEESGPLEYEQNGDNEETTILQSASNKNGTVIQVCTENEVSIKTSYPQPMWKQFQILLRRSVLCTLRDKLTVQLRVITHFVVGLLLGAVYYDVGNDASKALSNAGCIFFFMMFLFFANAMPSVIAIPLETSVVLREHLNNWYSLKAYFFSKLIADIPLQILCPTIFLLPGYFLTSQPYDGTRFLQFWAICFVMTIISHNFGLAAGAVINPLEISMFMVPASNIPLVLFSGFFLKLQDVANWLRWLTYVSYYRYSYEGAMLCLYGYNRSALKCSEPYCYFKSPLKFLQETDMVGGIYEFDLLALMIWAVILQLSVLLALKYRINSLQ
ncbi:ATP-binding cassette sub-family G member 4 [Cryptotermes secundus]|uniref:ATP-binding cassette sub-family G member 4 n=2 Tax=Cryptotermes secundus TaxID=105785 RepID=A0A2J7RQG6_9NEOP|nr:ATP-binding cassette sub-family G member 1 [Cryptotermes secundus]PNF43079.1 ATP-binding cassette sub-family G member 4 [Cryptotermes secundus]